MSTKQYQTAIVFGRFQPFHNQHCKLIEHACKIANNVIIVIGSANQARTPKNPFTFDERAAVIKHWIGGALSDTSILYAIIPSEDYLYSNQMWAESIQRDVDTLSNPDKFGNLGKTAIVGCLKDSSSFYLKLFPQWDLIEIPHEKKVDATVIRELIYENNDLDFIKGTVPSETLDFIKCFRTSKDWEYVLNERRILNQYKQSWAAAPYAPTFVTADSIVIQNGHILLIRRRAAPGQGLLALPGGFLEQTETIEQGIIRELREETRIKVPAPVLRGSIKEIKVFDAPGRSLRGRTITHAGLIVLEGDDLPKVKGSDDAEHAAWYPLGSLNASDFFEDHYSIINYFKGRI